MGGAVSINAEFRREDSTSVFELFDDKKTAKNMFDEIASYGQNTEGMRGKDDKIDLAELILFITKEVNPDFTDAFVKNTVVIKQAFTFSMGTKGKSNEMSFKEFKKLIPALLLFSHLWHIFESADDNVSDGRIFKPEFIRAKQSILDGKIEGVTMSEISDEDWVKEFDLINTTKAASRNKGKTKSKETFVADDFISYREFVTYVLKNIIKPAVYVKRMEESVEDDKNVASKSEQKSTPNAFVKMMSDLIEDMVEMAQQEESNQEEALANLEQSEEEAEEDTKKDSVKEVAVASNQEAEEHQQRVEELQNGSEQPPPQEKEVSPEQA